MANQPHSKGHSEESFNSYRSFWWNNDFIELMATRWKLADCHNLLDVGCGLCHWSLLLAEHLARGAKVDGLDSEEKWAVLTPGLREAFARRGANIQLTHGSALDLPYEADSFDVVTCQTLLIHLDDPHAAIREMVRVARPGGLIAVIEPNNTAFSVMADSLTRLEDVDARLRLIELSMVYELGKMKMGCGFNSLGDHSAELLRYAGLEDIRVYQSDKTTPLVPPYDSDEQQAMLKGLDDWFHNKQGSFDRTGYREAFAAVGQRYLGKFDELWKLKEQKHIEMMSAVSERSYYSSGGCLMYLASARKPISGDVA